jgi:hypothetical protein
MNADGLFIALVEMGTAGDSLFRLSPLPNPPHFEKQKWGGRKSSQMGAD